MLSRFIPTVAVASGRQSDSIRVSNQGWSGLVGKGQIFDVNKFLCIKFKTVINCPRILEHRSRFSNCYSADFGALLPAKQLYNNQNIAMGAPKSVVRLSRSNRTYLSQKSERRPKRKCGRTEDHLVLRDSDNVKRNREGEWKEGGTRRELFD